MLSQKTTLPKTTVIPISKYKAEQKLNTKILVYFSFIDLKIGYGKEQENTSRRKRNNHHT